MLKNYKKLKMLSVLLFSLLLISIPSSVFAVNCTCNTEKSGSLNGGTGKCTDNCTSNGVCWVDTHDFYCTGHNYVDISASTTVSDTVTTKIREEYLRSTYGSPRKISDSEQQRTRTDYYRCYYEKTGTITETFYMKCSICGHTFDENVVTNVYETWDTVESRDVTEYRIRGAVRVYHQDTAGKFHKTSTYTGHWGDWNDNTGAVRADFKGWSLDITDTHYASNTHKSKTKNDKNISARTLTYNGTREWDRYIYRKRYYLRLHPNKQSDASTGINNMNPEHDFSMPNGANYYQRLCYVDENFFVPKTYDTFQMIGYSSYKGWFTDSISGNNLGENGKKNWVPRLSGYPDPKKLYVYNVYTIWFSEPGKLYLMPNSSSLGTDSCYGAYIDDDNTEEDTYLFNNRPSSVQDNNVSK